MQYSNKFFTAVRAAVALAYPKGFEPDSSPTLERIPGPDVAPSRLIHGDIHAGNGWQYPFFHMTN